MLRRREKSSASASITWGEAWCFRGDWTGEVRDITGDVLDVEGGGEATALSTLSFGRLGLRRRVSRYAKIILRGGVLTPQLSAGWRIFFQPNLLDRVLCLCEKALNGLSVGREAS